MKVAVSLPKNATFEFIGGYFHPKMKDLDCHTTASDVGCFAKHTRQGTIMAIILFIYSSILALGVWQETQNQDC
jgi:hypothetical protein